MAKTIAIVNQKGGVGKTTTCVNLAAALKNQGCRVLVCDFDPQANTTSGFGVDKTTSPNIYDVLLNGTETAKAISSTSYGDVLPSNKALAGATIEMIALEQREYRLKNALEQKGGSVLLPFSYRARSWLGRKISSGKYFLKRVAKKILRR